MDLIKLKERKSLKERNKSYNNNNNNNNNNRDD